VRDLPPLPGGEMSKPILCLDFDGVIHSYSSGWKGAAIIPDPPVPGAIEFIERALKHFDVQIFSSRSNQEGGIGAMRTWLWAHIGDCTPEQRGLFNTIKFPTEKPSAMVTIDDRAITFTGEWPSIQSLLEFKPWNRK
jgi:hypothetical protein